MTTTTKILTAIIVIAFIAYLIYVNKKDNKDIVKYRLPSTPDPAVFGPQYWAALHDITHRIPCGSCRGFAEKFMVFFHDVVNAKLNRPLFDSSNYTEMMIYLNAPKNVNS